MMGFPVNEAIAKRRRCSEHQCHSERSEESHHGGVACRGRFFTPLRSVQNDIGRAPSG